MRQALVQTWLYSSDNSNNLHKYMNTKTKIPFEAGFFASLSLGVGIVLGASEYDRNIEKDFPVSPGGKLIVEADRGSIEVDSGGRDKVHVRVLRRLKGGSQAQADELFANHEVTFKQDGNNVSIIGRNTKDRFRFGGIRQPNLQVRFEISIPRKFDVDLKTSGGDIRLGELDGSAITRTSSGSIDLGTISGRVESSNSGGDIRIAHAGGDLVASTSSGSITIKKVNGGVDAKNSGGDINIETASGDVAAQTSSGSISVGRANGKRVTAKNSGGAVRLGEIEGDVVAQTSSGSIKIAMVKGRAEVKNSGGQISIGEAGSSVVAETSSGSIEITTAKGKLEAKNSGGDVRIGEADEETVVKTSSGSIVIKLAMGKVDAKNSGGKIEVNEARDVVLAHTSSGPIIVSLGALPKADSYLEVSGGDIKLALPRGVAIDLDAESSGGKFITAIPVTIT